MEIKDSLTENFIFCAVYFAKLAVTRLNSTFFTFKFCLYGDIPLPVYARVEI